MIENKAKIGLLPFYLKLYDAVMPDLQQEFEPFIKLVEQEFIRRNIGVLVAPVSSTAPEFETSVGRIENEKADCIVTLHLTYSPSLESINALINTRLPIVILDTTPNLKFDSTDLLMYNHGIHGVQDMCNLLKRKGKPFFIEAGHLENSDIIDRAVNHVIGIRIAKAFSSSRIGKIGESFAGMGDFIVDKTVFDAAGVKIVEATAADVAKYLPTSNDEILATEITNDTLKFDTSELSPDTLKRSVAAGLALRAWVNKENLTGLTINFEAITKKAGLPVMPFLEICKLMAEGIGYAGEGDVLNAAFTGALSQVLHEISFTEMFCPDWENDVIFLSHMGEMNIALADRKVKLVKKEWVFTDADSPVVVSACFKQGEALFINLAPGADQTFSLIIAPVSMLEETNKKKADGIRGWMKPVIPINNFLKKYSEAGGTHHGALIYGRPVAALKTFAAIMNWNFIEIK
jgi:L-arabinose isomerase